MRPSTPTQTKPATRSTTTATGPLMVRSHRIDHTDGCDGDCHGAGDPLYGCEVPEGFVATDDDCDDSDALRSPSLTEACNGYDDDRDDAIDEGVMTTFFVDADGDGWGAGEGFFACELSPGSATTSSDCDDTRAEVYPGADEALHVWTMTATPSPMTTPSMERRTRRRRRGRLRDPAVETVACDTPAGYVDNYTDCDPATTPSTPVSQRPATTKTTTATAPDTAPFTCSRGSSTRMTTATAHPPSR